MNLDFELRDEFLKGNLVLFVGAGFVRTYVNTMPLWQKLLVEVFSTLNGDEDEIFKYASPVFNDKGERSVHSGEFLRLAQEFELVRQQENKKRSAGGGNQVAPIHHQVQRLISDAYEDGFAHNVVENTQLLKSSNLPLNTWVTTNYDTFIEDTILQDDIKRGEAVVFRRPIRNSDFADRSAHGKTLYKIHGCVTEDPKDSIVITEDDYHRFLRQDRYFVNKLYTLFCERIVVFLGYSISDPNIQFIYNEVLFDQKLHDTAEELSFSRIRPAYFVSWSAIPAEQKAYYRYKKIRYIENCPIESFFEELIKTHDNFRVGLAGAHSRIVANEQEYADLVNQFDWDTDPGSFAIAETEKQDWIAKVLNLLEYYNSAYLLGAAKSGSETIFEAGRFRGAVSGMLATIDNFVEKDIGLNRPDLLQSLVKFTSARVGVHNSSVFKSLLRKIRKWLCHAGGLTETKDLTAKYLDMLLNYDDMYNSWEDYVFCLEEYVLASPLFPHMHPHPQRRYVRALYEQLRICGRSSGESWYSVEKVYGVWDKFDPSAWPALEAHIRGQSEDPDDISGKDKAILDHLRPSGDYRNFLPRS